MKETLHYFERLQVVRACNALFSVCWSVIRKVSLWKSYDLDNILIQGDKLYKSLNKNNYLNVDEFKTETSV